MSKIKFSKETFEILEAAAKINSSIKLDAGNVVKTISADEAVIMHAIINDEFPSDACIYDLGKFLNLFKLPALNDADIEFDDRKATIFGNRTKIQYWFCEETYIKNTDRVRDMVLPDVKLTVEVSQNDLSSFARGASLLEHKYLQFVVHDNKVKMVATAPNIDTSNNMEIDLGKIEESDDYIYTMDISNLKLIPGSYKVEISNRGITKWTNTEQPVVFYIVLKAEA